MDEVKRVSVLYVDDEVINLNAFKATYRRQFDVYTAVSAEEGRVVLETNQIDVVLSDHLMPGVKGIDFLKSIVLDHPRPIRMLLTAFTNPEAIKDALSKSYIHHCIYKPWDSNALAQLIKNVVR